MDEQLPNYRREFFKSKHHVWLGLMTLGMGFLFSSSLPLLFLLGPAAYALGWIYLPDMPFFRRTIDRRREEATQADATRQLAEFQQKRDTLMASLSAHLRKHYHELAEVCRQIEKASADSPLSTDNSPDPRLRKLDELMWTFLRLLGLEDSLERFLETERREDLPGQVRDTDAEIVDLSVQIEELKKQPGKTSQEAKERLLQSRLEALEVLRKRQKRIEEAQANLALVQSEQERLDHQIKLIRADAVTAKSTASISARIDATVEHLDQTNQWLAELSQFQDAVGDLPTTDRRVGYAAQAAPPPLTKQRQLQSTKQSGQS